jgi:hypothetical protein
VSSTHNKVNLPQDTCSAMRKTAFDRQSSLNSLQEQTQLFYLSMVD